MTTVFTILAFALCSTANRIKFVTHFLFVHLFGGTLCRMVCIYKQKISRMNVAYVYVLLWCNVHMRRGRAKKKPSAGISLLLLIILYWIISVVFTLTFLPRKMHRGTNFKMKTTDIQYKLIDIRYTLLEYSKMIFENIHRLPFSNSTKRPPCLTSSETNLSRIEPRTIAYESVTLALPQMRTCYRFKLFKIISKTVPIFIIYKSALFKYNVIKYIIYL